MSDVLIVTDKDFKILTINKAGIDLSGYNEDEIIGKPLFDFFEKSKTASFNEDSVILENDKFKNFEIIFKQKDKKGVYALFSTAELKDKSGKTKYFICTVKDISERKKAEEELKEYTRRIEAINRELDSYTYIVSHDLKEPLRSINGFSRFIISDYKDKLDETGQNYLDRIRANAIRIQSIVEDFLAVSYIDKKINSFEDVCLEEVMDDVKTRMEKKINQKGAEIIIKEKMPVIFCNRPGITDVFSNLASNAIKFADKKSIRIEIGWREDEEFYEFYVKDNGPGIEEQYFDKIFELFHRLVKREEYKGTGVGLTIAKKIVEIHRGKIWVKSKAGEGATFYFTIPRNKDIILAGAMKAINRNH